MIGPLKTKKKENEEQPSPKKPKSDKKPTTTSNDEASKKSTKEEPKNLKTGETKNTEPVKTAATPKPEKPKEDVKPSKAKKATELPPTKKDDKVSSKKIQNSICLLFTIFFKNIAKLKIFHENGNQIFFFVKLQYKFFRFLAYCG